MGVRGLLRPPAERRPSQCFCQIGNLMTRRIGKGTVRAFEIVSAYAAKAVSRSITDWGPLPTHVDASDAVQEVHLELIRLLGTDYGRLIDEARRSGFAGSP